MSQSPDSSVYSGMGHENFDLDVSSFPSEEGTPRVSNTHATQHPVLPSHRQQRQICQASRPAGSGRHGRRGSPDTLTFFEEVIGDKRKCKFCL